MENQKRWQDKLNLTLGIWMLASPFVLINPYAPIQFDLVTSHSFLMGLVVALAAGGALLQFNAWEEWLEVVLGAWLVASPFILGFSDMTPVLLNHVVVGVIIVADSISVLSEYPSATNAT